ncbi:MAG: FAD-dependent oxidoreductase [Bacillota bacterium]
MIQPRGHVCIIGAGPAGLSVAGLLAQAGIDVTLLEKEERPGGRLNVLAALYGPSSYAKELRTSLLAALDLPGVTLVTGARVEGIAGSPCAYTVRVNNGELAAAAVVVATGYATQYRPEDHGLALGAGVYSLSGLCSELRRPTRDLVPTWRGRRVGLVVDVSTTDSKVFSAAALRLALELKRRLACEPYVFCRDVKVAGAGLEELYGEARREGVTFVKHEGKAPTFIPSTAGFVARLHLPSLGDPVGPAPIELPLDLLVLDEAVVPAGGFDQLSGYLGIRLARRGRHAGQFYGDDNLRLLGTGTDRSGIFVCGGAQSDSDLEDTLASAAQAAADVMSFLETPAEVRAEVVVAKCARCLTCVRICPYHAIAIEYYREAQKAAATIDDMACRGCGACVAACPARAIELVELADSELVAELGGVAI